MTLVSQLTREHCSPCGETTLHSEQRCIHCGYPLHAKVKKAGSYVSKDWPPHKIKITKAVGRPRKVLVP